MSAPWTLLLPPDAVWRAGRSEAPDPGGRHLLAINAVAALPHALHGPFARPGGNGAPGWPAGVVGTVTHAGGQCVVAVAPATTVGSLGIDLEPLVPLPPAVWPHLLDADELTVLARIPAPERGRLALTLWCLKEALYKALRGRVPLTQLPLVPGSGGWRPSPRLANTLVDQGLAPPDRLVLSSMTVGAWIHASAWWPRTVH